MAAAPESEGLKGHRPVPLTPIVGREREAAHLRDLLARPTTRLLTLTGPGGVGKTRLAVEVASGLDAEFGTVAFVPLASVADPDLVVATIARAVGLQSTDETTTSALAAHLRPRTMLLILDNVEHLLGAGPALVDLLGAAPGLTVLVTSRALLRVSGEHVVTVPPLTLPDPGPLPPAGALAGYGAVRLFVTRARAVHPASSSTTRTPPTWSGSAGASTACRWRSSWSRPGSAVAWSCSRRAPTTSRSACGPCVPGSPGATTSCPRTSSTSSAAWPSSWVAARSPPSSPSARTTGPPPSTCSRPWSTGACSSR